jgi:hypothetical protein
VVASASKVSRSLRSGHLFSVVTAFDVEKNMIKQIVSMTLIASLTSCVSTYQLPDGYSGPTAVIKDSATKTGTTKAEAFKVTKIDGQYDGHSPMATPRGGGMVVSLKESMRTVPAGKPITLTISGSNIYAADGAAMADMLSGNAAKAVSGNVVLTPKPNAVYDVKGIVGKNSSSVWIEDVSHKKVGTPNTINT